MSSAPPPRDDPANNVAEPSGQYLLPPPSTGTLVDTGVLLDVFNGDPHWADWSIDQLTQCAATGPLYINTIVAAELSSCFESAVDLETTLASLPLQRVQLPWDAALLAGQAFRAYRRLANGRPAPLSDFYIGAHAWVQGLQVLTRDATRFRRHFPRLRLVSP